MNRLIEERLGIEKFFVESEKKTSSWINSIGKFVLFKKLLPATTIDEY